MLRADRLQEFVAIVDAGSISAAARTLVLPRATLSRRLTGLERSLGVRLVHRSTRRLALTTAGQELYGRARRVVADTEAAWAAVRQLDDTPRGPLRVSIPADHANAREMFVKFCEDHPEVRLEVSTNTRHVDLVAEGVDVAVRFGAIADASLVVRRLWTTRSIAVATPRYLKRHGTPATAADLVDHGCIVGFAGEAVPARTWPRCDGGTVPVNARLACSDLGLRIEAARRHLGIALLPERAIQADLDAGKLRVVLEDEIGTETPASLVFVDREFVPAQVRAFIDRATAFYTSVASAPARS